VFEDAGPLLAWTRPQDPEAFGSRTGDPLGLRVFVRHLAGRISPALTRSCTDVWGFGLLALGLHVAGHGVDAERRFLRWQRLLIFAAVHEDFAAPGWRTGGTQRAKTYLAGSEAVSLDRVLLTHERAAGIWGGYARASRIYGLIRQVAQGTGPGAYVTTSAGDLLAGATRAALDAPSVARLSKLVSMGSEVDLQQLGLTFPEVSGTQIRHLSAAVRANDQRHGGRLIGLWPQLDGIDTPQPSELDPATLANADQRLAVEHATAMSDLVEQVENAFRSEDALRLPPGLASHPGFEYAKEAGYGLEYEPVRRALADGGQGALAALWSLHQQRHPQDGRWPRDEPIASWANTVPDFGLDAPLTLYRQGVRL
jgi:hypothetical protein